VPFLKPIDLTKTHGVNFTAERIKKLAADYDPSIETASLNLDHDWCGPSHGWCSKLEVRGSWLWAVYVNLSEEVIEAIKSRQYTRCSGEFDLEHPATQDWYFTGLALLGTKRPAVWGMPRVSLHRPSYIIDLSKEEETSMATKKKKSARPTPKKRKVAPARAAEEDPEIEPTEDEEPEADQPEVEPEAEEDDDDEAVDEPEEEDSPGLSPVALRALHRRSSSVLSALLLKNARLEAKERLLELGSRVTPAMRRVAEPLLVALLSQHEAPVVKLATGNAGAKDVPIVDAIVSILKAVPEFEALGQGRLAEEEPEPLPQGTANLSAERLAELDRKYNLRSGYGFQGN
jgi:hypothetical protein